MAGIGFQLFWILFFMGLVYRLYTKIRHQGHSPDRRRAVTLLYIELAVVVLIAVRIVFRLIEYSHGLDDSISRKEVYPYIFDSTMMWIAIVLFNVFHSARLMPGKDSQWPSRKERKMMKRMGQEPGGRPGQDNLMSTFKDPASNNDGSQTEYSLLATRDQEHGMA